MKIRIKIIKFTVYYIVITFLLIMCYYCYISLFLAFNYIHIFQFDDHLHEYAFELIPLLSLIDIQINFSPYDGYCSLL